MRKSFWLTAAILCSLMLTGCFKPPAFVEGRDKEVVELVESYNERNKLILEQEEARKQESIKVLRVKEKNGELLVSADLDNAFVGDVVNRLLQMTDKPFTLDAAALNGRISTRFEDLLLLKALNRILAPSLLTAVTEEGNLMIRSELTDENIKSTDTVYAEVTVKNLDTGTVDALLDGLFPQNPQTGARGVYFGTLPETNTVYLNGKKVDVARTAKLLMKADSEVKHIMIEVVIVEFDSVDLEKLDANITDLSDGKYSGVNLNFGSFATQNLTFTRTSGANNPTQFTALIDILISNEQARLISRPYIGTLSGKPATINIATDRYVITETAESGATITAPVPISSGIIMKITPTLLPDNSIRMETYVEDSQFTESASSVSVEVEKNSAENVMQVKNKQTIIIGGLILNRQAWQNSGFPFLRNLPLFNLLFSKDSTVEVAQEVAIYVTPHIMEDSLNPPLIMEDAFKKKNDETFKHR